jgi:anti-anti-sigma factor
VGGATWRLNPAQARPALCTDPVCPQCGRVNDPNLEHCKSCGLIISRDIRLDIFNQYVLLKVNMQQLDFENSRILTQAFKNLSSKKRVIVDLGCVTFIDSSGIGALVTQTLRWGRYTADIKIIGLQPRVQEAVRTLQVDNVLGINDDLSQCLEGWGIASHESSCTF